MQECLIPKIFLKRKGTQNLNRLKVEGPPVLLRSEWSTIRCIREEIIRVRQILWWFRMLRALHLTMEEVRFHHYCLNHLFQNIQILDLKQHIITRLMSQILTSNLKIKIRYFISISNVLGSRKQLVYFKSLVISTFQSKTSITILEVAIELTNLG